ncbi:major histocompatibility complex class I-related gene protein-like isoform X2 [Aquarana catesbeiana]|uniref:major histocompatibility complex class I-related gene protein-like isoform X2 n=1 Tax=Aquarana catesbeiana TaxID=8400 RepID=UPI003CC9B5D9
MKLILLLILRVSAVFSVPPMVKVSGNTLNDVTKLYCKVYGFYPQTVTVRWIKNGIETIRENQADHILPNPDGTNKTILSIEVRVREVDTYSCHVNHSSLQETVIILWGYKAHKDQNSHGDSYPNIGLIFGLVAVVVFIGVLGLIIWKKYSDRTQNEFWDRCTHPF